MATKCDNDNKRYYYACGSCTAKWFSRTPNASCPRCGQLSESAVFQKPPWVKDREIDSKQQVIRLKERDMKAPVHTVRFGLIKACIWKNHTKAGDRHTVTVILLFRNGDVWSESSRFGRADLPLVCKAVDLAHSWIYQHGDSAEPSSQPTGARSENE